MATVSSDWLDDKKTYRGQGATITVDGDRGDFTDFVLSASQLSAVFQALAEHEGEEN